MLDPAVLRRLDRIDTVILDADVMLTGRSRLDEFAVLAGGGVKRLKRHAYALFDPHDPQRPQASRAWRLCPVSQLDAALPRSPGAPPGSLAKGQLRQLATGGRQVLGIIRNGVLVGLVAVVSEVDPEAELLAIQARHAGHELLVAGCCGPAAGAPEFDGAVAGGSRLAGEVRRLQREGKVVAVISARNGAALRAADCGIGVTTKSPAPWDADLLCADQLQEVSFLVHATVAAREVSRRSALLALGGSALGGSLALIPSPQASRRALILVNGAALTSIASGAWAGLNLLWQPEDPRRPQFPGMRCRLMQCSGPWAAAWRD